MSLERKPKISLPDYDYRRDIQNRLLMARFKSHEVVVLKEIIDGPLKLSIGQLENTLGASASSLLPSLKLLKQAGLLTIEEEKILKINKEARRYFEWHLPKFSPSFVPGIDFLKNLLNKVPQHALISWYEIPRRAETIFSAILENHLLTPKIYQKHLEKLSAQEPVLDKILSALFSADTKSIDPKLLMSNLRLTREQLEEQLLKLEFNFAACSCFIPHKNQWKEQIVPLHEWKEYCEMQLSKTPKTIRDENNIRIDDAATIPLTGLERFSHRDINRVTQSLSQVANSGWIYFDDFLRSLTASIGSYELKLVHSKKRWHYSWPDYDQETQNWIQAVIFKRLAASGVVITGTHEGKRCFCITPFGKQFMNLS